MIVTFPVNTHLNFEYFDTAFASKCFCVISDLAIISLRKREYALLYVHSSVCNHLDEEKRELVALLFYCLFGALLLYIFCNSSSRCRGLVCTL